VYVPFGPDQLSLTVEESMATPATLSLAAPCFGRTSGHGGRIAVFSGCECADGTEKREQICEVDASPGKAVAQSNTATGIRIGNLPAKIDHPATFARRQVVFIRMVRLEGRRRTPQHQGDMTSNHSCWRLADKITVRLAPRVDP
jgi:hypothetical protein